MSMICVRIGRVHEGDRPASVRDFSVWCSQRDVVSMILRCLQAPASVRFDVFFATSDNRWNYRDLDHPKTVLGWTPLDHAEDYRS
jgi:hypothetical protein